MLIRIILFVLFSTPTFMFGCYECLEDLEYQKEVYEQMIWEIQIDSYQEETTFYGDRMRSLMYSFYLGKIEAIDLAIEIMKYHHLKLRDCE